MPWRGLQPSPPAPLRLFRYLQVATHKLPLSDMQEKRDPGMASPAPVPGQVQHCSPFHYPFHGEKACWELQPFSPSMGGKRVEDCHFLKKICQMWQRAMSYCPFPCKTQGLSSRVATRSTMFGNSQPRPGFLTACPACKILTNAHRYETE